MAPWRFLILPLVPFFLYDFGATSDFTNLAFKGCADQNFPNSEGVYQQTLKILFDALISQSSSVKFYKTTAGDGASAINGLFQCRGDLSGDVCNNCVQKARSMAPKLCGAAIAVRVQLSGCYLRYEIAWFRPASETEFLYKVCESAQASVAGFGDRRDAALGEVVRGVGNGSGGGFYAGEYQSVYVQGQCEGDLGNGECVNCVKIAIDKAKSECGYSVSAQMYLQDCYISYSYNSGGLSSDQSPFSSSGSGWSVEKTVAVVLGGLVGMGLMMACLLFTRSIFKKKTHTYRFGG